MLTNNRIKYTEKAGMYYCDGKLEIYAIEIFFGGKKEY
jgi:hypothetical protein